jgi:hypothetical protein
LAVNNGAIAIPLLLVTTTALVVPLEKVPPAPLRGEVNVTLTPGTTFPKASITKACSGVANKVWTAVVCVFPPTTLIEAGGPGVTVTVTELLVEVRLRLSPA